MFDLTSSKRLAMGTEINVGLDGFDLALSAQFH